LEWKSHFQARSLQHIRYVVDVSLILASSSPRRHELLIAAGIPHIVQPTSICEDRLGSEPPEAYVRRLAEAKARAAHASPSDIVLGADTAVFIDDEILGKPIDAHDAARMLRLLSGRDHWVHTGICLLKGTRVVVDAACTMVSFAELTDSEIQEYTQSGEPAGKAGAYAIQGQASKFVRSICGSYHNVVGLPVSLVYSHLRTL